MKDVLKKIFHGFLFGLGLGVALVATIYISEKAIFGAGERNYVDFDEESGLVITGQHERKIDNGVVVLGAVENKGGRTWRNIELEAEIYDKEGIFIDECTKTIEYELAPDQKENFKITCGGCSSNKYSNYGSASVRILDAYYISNEDS